jgi:hypothetical protein
MKTTEWDEWKAYHQTLFALRSDADLEMVALWQPMLAHHSFAALKAASDQLIKDPPSYRDKHIVGLLRILDGNWRRRIDAMKEQEKDSKVVECGTCCGRGLVNVPHPSCIVEGEIVEGNFGSQRYFATAVVYCSCAKGCRMHTWQVEAIKEAKTDGQKGTHELPGTLADYEARVCGHWRDLIEEMERMKKERRDAIAKARKIDQRHGPMAKEIRTLVDGSRGPR